MEMCLGDTPVDGGELLRGTATRLAAAAAFAFGTTLQVLLKTPISCRTFSLGFREQGAKSIVSRSLSAPAPFTRHLQTVLAVAPSLSIIVWRPSPCRGAVIVTLTFPRFWAVTFPG